MDDITIKKSTDIKMKIEKNIHHHHGHEIKMWNTIISNEFYTPVAIPSIFQFLKSLCLSIGTIKWNKMKYSVHISCEKWYISNVEIENINGFGK